MEYRRLGRTGLRVGAIGLGTEYLQEESRSTVVAVVQEAIAQGVNYIDALFAPANYRDNLGAALQGRRDRVIIAGHLGAAETNGQYRLTRDPQESEKYFLDLLTRLRIDYVDILFLTNCDDDEDYRRLTAPGGGLEMARRYQKEGKARFIGFSGHRVATSRLAVESGAIDVLMHPVNLSQAGDAARNELFHLCAQSQVGLVAMKPFAGGELLQARAPNPATPVQCLAYTLSRIGVSTAVPGVKSVAELRAALAYFGAPTAARDFQPLLAGPRAVDMGTCVYCNHCLPCPAGIDIGQTTRLLVTARYSLTADLRDAYRALPALASECIECGECNERCPFDVDAVTNMQEAAHVFEA